MAKNLVVCCDGTGNRYGDHNTNVVRLYSSLNRDPASQMSFYDPGVGTFSVHPALTKTARGFFRLLGLGFGLGLTKNIQDAYWFLMQNYEEGDKVFLFGFSRGAYTARAVAALINKCGLLYPDNQNLIADATRIFKREIREPVVAGFQETFARPCPIHFLGLWDTVTSVGWVWDPLTLPYTTNNPNVSVVRHAVSIDECRAFYRQNLWGTPPRDSPQDVKQVWFAGVHSDVGGSYPENESGLSKIALEWMMVEAVHAGLFLDGTKSNRAVSDPVQPDCQAMLHQSMKWYWWPGEVWPKLRSDPRDHFRRKPHFNLGKRRTIPSESLVHESVLERKEAMKDYRPSNIPDEYRVEPWVQLSVVVHNHPRLKMETSTDKRHSISHD